MERELDARPELADERAERPTSPMDEAMQDLARTIHRADELAEQLRVRLGPVLGADHGTVEAGVARDRDEVDPAPLVSNVRHQASALDSVCDVLAQTLRRIEV